MEFRLRPLVSWSVLQNINHHTHTHIYMHTHTHTHTQNPQKSSLCICRHYCIDKSLLIGKTKKVNNVNNT